MDTLNPFKSPDLEVKDPHLIFESVWKELVSEFGLDKLSFPREIFWLNGAPGAGKGTQTELIRQYKELTAPPIAVSSLLKSPEAQKIIATGRMVSDKEVTALVFRELLKPEHQLGALVDGFPRTGVQVEILKLFYERLQRLRIQMHGKPDYETRFPKPHFRIVVLYIDEEESVKRQLYRGQKALEHNEQVKKSGVGVLEEVRPTDTDPEVVRKRYQIFKEVTYEALKPLKTVFDCHFIDGQGTIEQVRQRIEQELVYQSSLELEPITYDRISRLPIVSEVLAHARQELVKRLDSYSRHNSALFLSMIALIQDTFMPIIRRQALSGLAIVPITSAQLADPLAQAILVDIFAERGYRAVVYEWSHDIPTYFDLKTGEITCRRDPTFRVEIRFQEHKVRR